MYYYNPFTVSILQHYRTHIELIDSQPIPFTGTAGERVPPIFTSEVNADCLIWAGNLNFDNAEALIRIRSVSPMYEWMSNNTATPQDTPVGAVFGISTQAMPVLPLVMPFFIKANGRLQMLFTNGTTTPVEDDEGAAVTWRMLKLVDGLPNEDGTFGWDYGRPWKF